MRSIGPLAVRLDRVAPATRLERRSRKPHTLNVIDFLLAPSWLTFAVAVPLGLIAGSFLNVVAYRLPIMLSRRWRDDAIATLELSPPSRGVFNLALPRSHCPECRTTITAVDNVPVLSWFLLRGKCRHCAATISVRYPLVELASATLLVVVVNVWGANWHAASYYVLLMALFALALIDFDKLLLPDQITLPLLWLGLAAAAAFDGRPTPADALFGAIAGYGVLWLFYWAHKLLTRREGMGYGDFKLLAALGAWLGWQAILPIILVSCTAGILYASVGLLRGKTSRTSPIPFGPFLCLGGAGALFFTNHLAGGS